MATAQLVSAVPFYAGLTLEEISGHGVRWQDRDAAAKFPQAPGASELDDAAEVDAGDVGATDTELEGYRSLWDAPEVLHSPSLAFLHPDAPDADTLARTIAERSLGAAATAGAIAVEAGR
jgi:NADH-quinone oxidoreductase subunit G